MSGGLGGIHRSGVLPMGLLEKYFPGKSILFMMDGTGKSTS